jgi:tetratricopeptide (TPR) repeat protein
LFGYYLVAGDVAESARLAGWMSKVAAGDATAPQAVMSELVEGVVNFARGECAAAHARFEGAISRYQPEQHELHLALFRLDPGVYALAESARTLWLLGQADEAVERARRAMDVARAFEHPQSLAFAMTFVSIVHQLRRDATDALAWTDRTIALCDEHDIAQERAWVLPVRAWALAATGQLNQGIALGRQAIEAYLASGSQHTLPYYYALLADSLLAAGRTTEAIAECDAGLAASARMGEIVYDSELHRLRGECLLHAGNGASEARRHFMTALEIARAQGARPYEVRAAHALAAAGARTAKV